jgi:hypothetical protein
MQQITPRERSYWRGQIALHRTWDGVFDALFGELRTKGNPLAAHGVVDAMERLLNTLDTVESDRDALANMLTEFVKDPNYVDLGEAEHPDYWLNRAAEQRRTA